MFCINCGKELPPKAKFCPNCGTPVATVDQIIPKLTKMTASSENGHEWVDLGLSVKWATCNIGAKRPEDYGDFFAWGEISPKESFEWINYRFLKKKPFVTRRVLSNDLSSDYGRKLCGLLSKYTKLDGLSQLDICDDAARFIWGGRWRMPTESEFEELISQCIWTWTELGGKKGYMITGQNENSIFLPAAGYRPVISYVRPGPYGYYWASILDKEECLARHLFFKVQVFNLARYPRKSGLSVRPVIE